MIERKPTYQRIAEILRESVETTTIPPGTVLLEGPLASLFQSSRAPVKQALATLEREGLVRRFEGRGLVAGRDAAPLRRPIEARMLVSLRDAGAEGTDDPTNRLYYEVEREVILHSLFGRFRVNELALARHYDIGRSAAGEILRRAHQAGLLAKDERSRWSIVPLDHARFRHLYQLRELLEPAALASAAGHIPAALLDEIAERHRNAVRRYPDVDVGELDRLEEDLHITCLSHASNPELIEALKRSRSLLVSGKHIQMALLDRRSVDPFMDEHLAVLDHVQAGRIAQAQATLTEHIRASGLKAIARLDAFHAQSGVANVDYIAPISSMA